MGFHETRFPVDISYRSSGGPGFGVEVIQSIGGREERVSRFGGAGRRYYNAGRGLRELDDGGNDDMGALLEFWIARQGATYGFRYKDHLDFTTAANHRGAPSATDEDFGTGDGTTTQFQLVKRYVDPIVTRVRTIRKPVAGTVLISVDGVEQTSGWSVDVTTGFVTFSTAPAVGEALKWGGEHDVPVRFNLTQDAMQFAIESYRTGEIPDIPIIEMDDDDVVNPEEFFYGGASTSGAGGLISTFAADMTITPAMGRVIVLTPTAGGLNANLPDAQSFGMRPGGIHFFIKNASGSNAFNLLDQGLVLITAVAAGEMVQAFLDDQLIWHVLA